MSVASYPKTAPCLRMILIRTGIWVSILCVGVLLLYGRYDWSEATQEFARRGFLSSTYIFVIFLPTFYYTLAHFVPRPRVVQIATLVVGLLCTLPYHWLGLEQWYYYANRDSWFYDNSTLKTMGSPELTPDWFPGALMRLPAVPYEALFFGGLLAIGLAIAAWNWKRGPQAVANQHNRYVLGCVAIYACILLQTWLHLSLRSPYTYLSHYERSPEEHYWYHVYLFPHFQAAVNADYFVFRSLEQHFMGDPRVYNLMLIRRSGIFYISSQFSYFINTFYVFLVINIVLWMGAVVCGYQFIRNIWGEKVAVFCAVLISSGTGFIMYVGQPTSYLAGYAMIVIIVYLFDELCNRNYNIYNVILFSLLLGLSLMVYDIIAIYLFLLCYGLLNRIKIYALLGSSAVAFVIYSGFMIVQNQILHTPIDQSNTFEATRSFQTIVELILHPQFDQWYILTLSWFSMYAGYLINAFFIFPVVFAMFGLLLLQNKLQKYTIMFLLLPSFLVLGYMHFGGTYVAVYPRFVYVAYPAIYTLAALSLNKVTEIQGSKFYNSIRGYIPWAALILCFVWNNMDVFGFPSMYYHFYFSSGYAWLPTN